MDLSQRREINPAKVAAARERVGLRKYQAAKLAGLSKPAYYRWEAQEKGPLRTFDAHKLERLRIGLGAEIDDLTDLVEDSPLARISTPRAGAFA